jgi:single-strand DNA-binding protein
MASFNRVILMGNCTKDPVSRTTPKGVAITEIAMAINRVTKDANGDRREEVFYADVVLFARVAEIGAKYLKRGSPVFVEGRLKTDTWEDRQTGAKRSKLVIIGEGIQLLGDRQQEPVQERPAAKPEDGPIQYDEHGDPDRIPF